MFLVLRYLTDSWRKKCFYVSVFIDKILDKKLFQVGILDLVSVVSNLVAPKTLVRKLPG